MSYQTEIRNQVNEKLIAAMTKGQLPWVKPWSPMKNTGHPANASTGKLYRGINPLLLELAALDKGYASKHWATYRQWLALGCQVRKGERGTRIIFWQPITRSKTNGDGEEVEIMFPLLKEYAVFNAGQCDGAERYQVQVGDHTAAAVDFEPAQQVIDATGWDVRHVFGDRAAYYRPPHDYIVLPPKEQFASGPFGMAGYYGTGFTNSCTWESVGLTGRVPMPSGSFVQSWERPTLLPRSESRPRRTWRIMRNTWTTG